MPPAARRRQMLICPSRAKELYAGRIAQPKPLGVSIGLLHCGISVASAAALRCLRTHGSRECLKMKRRTHGPPFVSSVTPHQASAVVTHDLVVGYRGSRHIGISPSRVRGCRRTGGADIRRWNTPQAVFLADTLRLEYRSWRIVHYLGDSYSAARQKRPEDRGDQEFASHVLFTHSMLCVASDLSPAVLYMGASHKMLHCKILMFLLLDYAGKQRRSARQSCR